MLSISDLEEANAFLNGLLENVTSAVFIVDKNHYIRVVNKSFKELFHKSEDKILGQSVGNALGCVYAVEEEKKCGETSYCQHCTLRDSLLQAFSRKITINKAQLIRNFYINKQNITKYFQYAARNFTLNNEEMVMVIFDDITELMETHLKIKQMAVYDGLTKLYNHKHSFYKLEEEVSRAKRYGNKLSIIMFDIDRFKFINDIYGHQTGDRTLAAVSSVIKTNLRDIDHAGRYGGEEFLAILPQTSLENAYLTAERIRTTVEAARFEGGKIKLTISGGVVEFQGEDPLALIGKADEALFKAKGKGKNRIEK